eukprot:g7776.t1
MAPSSPFTAFEAETFASRYADNGGGSSMVSRSGYMSDCRSNHTMGSPSHSRWASYPGAGSSIDGVTDRGGGERTRDRDHSGAEQGEERGGPGTPASNWVMQSANELPHCQHPSRSTPTTTGAEHARDRLRGDGGGFVVGFAEPHAARSSVMGRGYRPGKTSWTVSPLSSAGGRERYRRGDSLPSTSSEQPQRGAEYGRAASRSPIEEEGASLIGAPVSILGLRDRRWHQSHSPSSPVAAEVAALMTAQGSPPSWDFGSSRRSGVKARLTQARDGLPSVGQGGRRWSPDTDGRSSDPGAYTGSSFDQELGHDERLRRGSPVWDQHYYRHHTGCLGQDHASQLTSTFPSASAATTVALHWQGRGGSDADMSSTGGRDGAADSVRLPDRVPGLAEASPTVGNQAGGRSSFRLGEQRDGSSRYAGSGVGGGDGGGGGGDRAAGAARMEGGGAKLLRAHSEKGMVDVVSRRCLEDSCMRRPLYNLSGLLPAYCRQHKLPEMIDVISARCQEPIEADRREEEMEEQHTGLTTSSFRGLDLRCTGLRQGYRPPDRVRAFHDSSGRWSPQWQAFPQTLHADPPRPTPSPRRLTQPLLTHPGQRQEASWQPTSLVRIARVAAVNADYPATTGDAFVSRADRRQSDDPAKVGTSSSSRLSEEGVATSRFGDNASDAGLVHGSWRRSTHRFHLIDPSCHPRWSSNPSLEPLLTGRARWAGGLLHNADRSSVEQVAGEGDPEGALLGWPSQSPNEQSYRHQHPSVPSPTMTKAKRMRGHRGIASIAEFPETIQAGLDTGYQPGAPSWAAASARGRKRYREADSPPSASAQLQRQAPDDALDMGSVGERSGGKGRQTQQGGVLASPEMGGDRWSDAAERSSGGLASYADINHKRELYHDERLQRGGSPVLGQYYHRQSSQLQNHEENGLRRSQQQHSMFPRPSTTVGQLTLGGDYIFRGSTGTVLPPPLSGFADSPRSSRLPPGLADAVASVGGRAAGGGTLFTFGGGGDNAGVAAGAGAAAVKSDGHHQRVSGMVDTRHPQCHNKQCTKQPSFGLEGDRRPSYCATHKEAGMINVASRRCQHFQCIRSPNFGFPGDKRATYCNR